MANPNITLTLDLELLQEALIALRDRHFQLCGASRTAVNPAVAEILHRQTGRVYGYIADIEDILQAATGARA